MNLSSMFVHTKRAKLQRLTILRDRFVADVPDDKFRYDRYVTRYDGKAKCGTICCIIGWLPKIFPTVFKWAQVGAYIEVKIKQAPNFDFHSHVRRFFGIDQNIYGFMFEGRELIGLDGRQLQPAVADMRRVTKKAAVRRMNRAIELIQNDMI